ncbi:MAG: hypothetical protein Q9M43_02735 [Sulfurimonas sp.]|nr:hypothetical protein [Sulfurimonas sp.]
MKDREEIKILWEGPFKIDDILNNNIDQKYDVTARSQGIYQIYGSHPLYGNGVLVYIGRTKDVNGFKSRLKGRWVIENGSDTENVEVYLGTIFSDSKKIENENDLIDKSEVLLINAMKPAYNSSNIQSANEDFIEENFILHNEGNYRSLYPVLDSKYFWKTYENFAIINKYAEVIKDRNSKDILDEDNYYGFIVNEDTMETDKYELWLCVDYKIWNDKKLPLTLQIVTEEKRILTTLKKSNDYHIFNYADDTDDEFYYKGLSIDENIADEIHKIKKQISL